MTIHPKCKTCEYFNSEEDKHLYLSDHLGSCERAKHFWNATEWKTLDNDGYPQFVLKEENKNDLAFVQDGSDYKAWLITNENFYCPMHSSLEGN